MKELVEYKIILFTKNPFKSIEVEKFLSPKSPFPLIYESYTVLASNIYFSLYSSITFPIFSIINSILLFAYSFDCFTRLSLFLSRFTGANESLDMPIAIDLLFMNDISVTSRLFYYSSSSFYCFFGLSVLTFSSETSRSVSLASSGLSLSLPYSF